MYVRQALQRYLYTHGRDGTQGLLLSEMKSLPNPFSLLSCKTVTCQKNMSRSSFSALGVSSYQSDNKHAWKKSIESRMKAEPEVAGKANG